MSAEELQELLEDARLALEQIPFEIALNELLAEIGIDR
jgi:hypothetical protein